MAIPFERTVETFKGLRTPSWITHLETFDFETFETIEPLTWRPNGGTIILTRFHKRRLIYNFDKEGKGRNVLNSGFLSTNKLPRARLGGFLFDWYERGTLIVAINT